jgi:hypothetical protein
MAAHRVPILVLGTLLIGPGAAWAMPKGQIRVEELQELVAAAGSPEAACFDVRTNPASGGKFAKLAELFDPDPVYVETPAELRPAIPVRRADRIRGLLGTFDKSDPCRDAALAAYAVGSIWSGMLSMGVEERQARAYASAAALLHRKGKLKLLPLRDANQAKWAIQGAYVCEESAIYLDSGLAAADLSTAFARMLDHLIRDKNEEAYIKERWNEIYTDSVKSALQGTKRAERMDLLQYAWKSYLSKNRFEAGLERLVQDVSPACRAEMPRMHTKSYLGDGVRGDGGIHP